MKSTYFGVRLLIVLLFPPAVVQSQKHEQHGEVGTASGMLLRQIWAGPDLGRNYGNNTTPSPDGRYIAFNELISPGHFEVTTGLGIHDVAAGTNRVITKVNADDTGFIGAIAWAPDGQRLAYQWYSWKARRNELRVIKLDGSSMRVYPSDDPLEPIAWTPDAGKILVVVSKHERILFLDLVRYVRSPKTGDGLDRLAWVSEADGSIRTFKTLPARHSEDIQRWPSLSPDGKYIAYSRTQGASQNRDIFVVSDDGERETAVVEHADNYVLGWAPNSKLLFFASDRNETIDVWQIGVVDGKAEGLPQRLKRDIGQVEPMGVNAKGALYYRFGDFLTDSYEATLEPITGKMLSAPKPMGNRFGGSFSSPDWSPDGRWLVHIVLPAAFGHPASGRPPSSFGARPPAKLFILSLETGEEKQIAPQLRGTVVRPRWRPNGKSISVQASGENGREGIFSVDPDTGSVEPLVPGDGSGFRNTGWSVDGNSLVYEKYFAQGGKSHMAVVVRRVDTGEEHQIFLAPYTARPLVSAVSPVTDQVAILADDRLSVTSISGQNTRELLQGNLAEPEWLAEVPGSLAWTRDGRYILFAKTNGDRRELWRIPAEGGQAVFTGLSVAGRNLYFLRSHPDGRRIGFVVGGSRTAEIWAMENFLY